MYELTKLCAQGYVQGCSQGCVQGYSQGYVLHSDQISLVKDYSIRGIMPCHTKEGY